MVMSERKYCGIYLRILLRLPIASSPASHNLIRTATVDTTTRAHSSALRIRQLTTASHQDSPGEHTKTSTRQLLLRGSHRTRILRC
jgi:hypothetical protein